jgi:ABC-type nitrate/sulfonate/bicarbonate transport system ATPase subunit
MVLSVKNLTFRYSPRQQNLIENFHCEVPAGQMIVLMGPSGSGKSTLLRLLGELIKSPSETQWLQRPAHVGWVFQEPVFLPWLKMLSNLLLVRFHNTPTALSLPKNLIPDFFSQHTTLQENILSWLPQLELDQELLQRFPRELSGGQRMRFAILRALLTEPSCVFLDEPLSSLDPDLRRRLQYALKSLFKKLQTAVVWVSHDFQEALQVADEIWLLGFKGQIHRISRADLTEEELIERFHQLRLEIKTRT